jgi:hypothetical protein
MAPPQSATRGARKAGIGQRRGYQMAPKYTWGANSPGSIFIQKRLLLLRSLFASSPFAHAIPQSRRRAQEDLFRASLRPISLRPILKAD